MVVATDGYGVHLPPRSGEREMEEEFRSHPEIRAADLERQRLSRREAERRARIEA